MYLLVNPPSASKDHSRAKRPIGVLRIFERKKRSSEFCESI